LIVVRIQSEAIVPDEVLAAVRGDRDGAEVLFVGAVRNHNEGRRVQYLEYHAYPAMAEQEMAKLRDQAFERFEISEVAIVHRTGRMEIGDAAVAIAVAAPHRAPAFDACRWIIDTLKQTVPIWKKEFFEGGEVWVEEEVDPAAE
jgi:molybdopterin synthase catalytic subunit